MSEKYTQEEYDLAADLAVDRDRERAVEEMNDREMALLQIRQEHHRRKAEAQWLQRFGRTELAWREATERMNER